MSFDTGGQNPMMEMYVGGPFAVDPTDPRNQFHERALVEARLVQEYREGLSMLAEAPVAEAPRLTRVVARLRFAFSGGPTASTPQSCDCLAPA